MGNSGHTLIKISLFLFLFCQMGCATGKITSRWQANDLVIDGRQAEWDKAAHDTDKKQYITVKALNNAETIFLCVSTTDGHLKRQFYMRGMTIWINPNGNQDQVFGLHLSGSGPGLSGPMARPGSNFLPPSEHQGHLPTPRDEASFLSAVPKPLKDLEITYGAATGPLRMKMDAVRRTGIDIGMANGENEPLVYELAIKFKAAPCLSAIKQGDIVGVGILTGTAGRVVRKEKKVNYQVGGQEPGLAMGGPGGGMGGPGGDMGDRPGTMGGGPPGSRPGDRDGFKFWLKVKLARDTKR